MACICYISRERVDTLFEQAFDGVSRKIDAFDKAVKRSHSH